MLSPGQMVKYRLIVSKATASGFGMPYVNAFHDKAGRNQKAYLPLSASYTYRIILQDSKEHLMAANLTWNDAEKIGVLLARKHPEIDPLSIDFEELRRRVTDLAEFQGESETNKNKLEAIRAAWHEEVIDRTQ
jgi:FeS assembly protein IscX